VEVVVAEVAAEVAAVGPLPAGMEGAMAAAMVAVLLLARATATPMAGAATPSAPVAGQRSQHRAANIAPVPQPGGCPPRGLAMRIRQAG
jgi:hypothetical protein